MARSDRFTSQDRKTQVYSDFLTDLNTHPVSDDIVRYVNENAVIRAIKNLIMTKRTERLYQPSIGGDIERMLFEPMGDATALTIASLVRETIANHEPRAKVLKVDVIPNYDKGSYTIGVTILVINKSEPVTFTTLLTRVR